MERGFNGMVKNVIITCDDSPIGKNSALESIRMGAGISAVGDLDSVKIIFIGDSVLLLSKKYNPKAVNMDVDSNIFRMLDLADMEVYVLNTALEDLGMQESDLIEDGNIQVVNIKELVDIFLKADTIYNY